MSPPDTTKGPVVILLTAPEDTGRASIHFSRDGKNFHVGVVFPTPNSEANQVERTAKLRIVANMLVQLDAGIGQAWSGSAQLNFPD